MQPIDTEALELAAWHDFVRRLSHQLAGLWPAMEALLGERYEVFVKLAVEQAGKLGLTHAASVARYVDLCFVWGPAFQDKAGFEWALEALSRAGEFEWLSVHQLVQRSLLELQRLPGSKVEPQALTAADAALLNEFEVLGRQGAMLAAIAQALPRAACDLEAMELRLLEADGDNATGPQEYRLENNGWQRAKIALPAALLVDANRPLPALIAVLSPLKGQGRAAKLQLRARSHAVCAADIHPALSFSGPLARWDWAGHETRAVSWPVLAREQPAALPGPGCVIAEESSPELYKLELAVCGLRDEGAALGSMQTLVYAWPAAQWWMEIQRARPDPTQPQALLPGARAWARGISRCRVERDGEAQDSVALQQQFELGLDGAVADGLQKLALAWEQTTGLSDARLGVSLGLLVGKMACTWGWRLGAGGLNGRALMRLVALIEMEACIARLEFGGELMLADSRTRINLLCSGQAALQQRIQHEVAGPALSEALLSGVVSWSFAFELSLEPIANDAGCLLQQAGPLTGALVGEAGLRPNSRGGSGWEWFIGLRIEAVTASLQWTDPLLGQTQQLVPLLPAMTLLDWSMG
ncbi:hypothetical protein [Roseateles oligotrophus]|uniref:Uncharacterized protein n=1 Tax=Roseateles oligotrophus TaxID=1769250 RepID=A0ABT2YG49_9BURK|nr:hypothetical protein [Roseateles oligotrophus]MCV2369030.1 hypothetical protein [Roseateles oligotrophus]